MGLMDYVGDIYASLTWHDVEAEAPESGWSSPIGIVHRGHALDEMHASQWCIEYGMERLLTYPRNR